MRHLYTDHRKVLLIDSNAVKQTLRANVFRNHEVEVDTASGMDDAERFWTAHAYDLVLLAAQECSDEAAALTKRVREVRPRQRLALLVGPPLYIREIGGFARSPRTLDLRPQPRRAESLTAHGFSPQWQAIVQRLMSSGQLGENPMVERSEGPAGSRELA